LTSEVDVSGRPRKHARGGEGGVMTDLQKQFEAAQAAAKNLSCRPDNDTLLELYSYFKQATAGDVDGPRPGAFDFVARAKYDAWEARKGVKKDAAMRAYIKLVEHLQSL
jgi:diazepam-binding inhibitor (GABA receptor modulating acyl-CoA-binding protein)